MFHLSVAIGGPSSPLVQKYRCVHVLFTRFCKAFPGEIDGDLAREYVVFKAKCHMSHRILVVEDDPGQRRLIAGVVRGLGYETLEAPDGRTAELSVVENKNQLSLVLMDLHLPDLDGVALMGRLRDLGSGALILAMTADHSVATAMAALKAGAHDYLLKPVAAPRLEASIRIALSLSALRKEVRRLSRRADNSLSFEDLIAESPSMRRAIDLARRGAGSDIPMLIEGESGVGKEVFARAAHGASPRSGGPFVAVNCGALPETLVEATLFGHEKGAFTGAAARRAGKFQEADGGSLFLDEVGELPLTAQVKLLRALQEREVEPVGAAKPVKVDIRLISATNRSLRASVADGAFREDLFYRLSAFPVALPPLIERREDIGALAAAFVARFALEENRGIQRISPDAISGLVEFDWPGNVRQLQNAVYRAVVLSEPGQTELHVRDFAELGGYTSSRPARDPGGATDLMDWRSALSGAPADRLMTADGHIRSLEEVEAEMIARALDLYRGRMAEVARRLGIGRSTLYRKVGNLQAAKRGA